MSTTPTPAPTTTVDPQPKTSIAWDAPDGKHYEGSAEELFKIASERYNNLYPEYGKIKGEAQQLREQQELIQQATRGTQPQGPDQFNQQQYWQLMQQNPLEAQRYANRFDPDYQNAVKDLRTTRQNQEASIFRTTFTDFEPNEANVEALARNCQELFPGSEVYSARQMGAAYALIKTQPSSTTTTPPGAPPAPPAQSTSGPTTTVDYTKLTQDQLKALIQDMEAKGAR